MFKIADFHEARLHSGGGMIEFQCMADNVGCRQHHARLHKFMCPEKVGGGGGVFLRNAQNFRAMTTTHKKCAIVYS